MSWGALPFWVYQVDCEQYQMKLLGAMNYDFSNEIRSGGSRSLPGYNHCWFSLKGEYDKSTNR